MLSPKLVNHKYDFLEKEKSIEDITSKEAVEIFKKTVNTRDQMGGAMHFNMLNEQCHKLYDVCRQKGTDDTIMNELNGMLAEYR